MPTLEQSFECLRRSLSVSLQRIELISIHVDINGCIVHLRPNKLFCVGVWYTITWLREIMQHAAREITSLTTVFKSINKLRKNHNLSNVPASTHLCNKFMELFNTNIYNIRNHIISTHTSAASSFTISAFSDISLSNFAIHDSQSLCNVVLKIKATTSRADPVPLCLFKSCFDSLCPVVLGIINDSLCTGVVPTPLKIAAVTPVSKTNNVDFDNLNNF